MSTATKGTYVLPRIEVNTSSRAVEADKAWKAIVAHGKAMHPMQQVFLIGDRLVRISQEDEGYAKLIGWDGTSLTEHLDRIAVFYRRGRDGEVEVTAPRYIAQALLSRTPDFLPGASKVARVTDVPVFGPESSEPAIEFVPGYHQAAQSYYAPGDDLAVGGDMTEFGDPAKMDEQQEAVEWARGVVLSVLQDFPFADKASYVHAIAMMLEPFARELIGNKPTPMYAVTAELPETGKSLLVNACLYPAIGERTAVLTYVDSEDEMRKTLTSYLVEGRPAMWIDNIPQGRAISSATLAACLTAPRWEARILGHTKMASVPIRNLWVMTANNPSLSSELARRCIPIRLTHPHPAGYRYKLDLESDWLERNRSDLVTACLILVANYAEGSELGADETTGELHMARAVETKVRRSYRKWSEVIGGILRAAGLTDFLGNLDEWMERSAVEVADDAGFAKAVHARVTEPLALDELIGLIDGTRIEDAGPVELPLALAEHARRSSLKIAMQYYLRAKRDAPFDGYRWVRHGADSPYRWEVVAS